jgi:hypothetical protein
MFNPTAPATTSTTVAEKPTLGQAMKEGFGFGFGQAAAHSLFRSIFGSGQSSGQPTSTTSITGATAVSPSQLTSYQQCLKESNNDTEACKYLDSSD